MVKVIYGCVPGEEPKAYSLDECVPVPRFTMEEFRMMTPQEKLGRARKVYTQAGDHDALRRLDEEVRAGTNRFASVPLSSLFPDMVKA